MKIRFRKLKLNGAIWVIFAAVCSQAIAAESDPSPKAEEDTAIPYVSLDQAIEALRATPGVTFRSEGGWIVAYDSAAIVSWLLTPKGHPAYPSIVKRYVVNSASGASMATDVRCFAAKAVCDKYFGGK